MLIQNYDLDMVPSGIPLTIHISQYDTDVQLVFKLFASHGTLNLNSGATVMIRGLKRDGNGISVPCTFTYADNVGTVTVKMTKQMTAVAGRNTFELYVKTSGGELYSANFILHVERSALDLDAIPSDSDIRELADLAAKADALIAAAEISQQTQEYMSGLTERAESASGTAVLARDTAVSAKNTAVEAKDTAVAAVDGFQETVNAAKQTATEAVQAESNTQAARIREEGSVQVEALRDEKDNAISAMEESKNADISDIQNACTSAVGTVNGARDAAVAAVGDTRDTSMQSINQKAQEIAAVKSDADTTAALALQAANQALNEVGGVQASVEEQNAKFSEIDISLAAAVDGGYVENDSLYLTHNGEVVAGPFTGFGGGGSGGGGGSSNSAKLVLNNTSGWVSKTISHGSAVTLNLEWSSIEDEMPTGNGTLIVRVNSTTKAMIDVAQGPISIEVGSYLSVGVNDVQVSVTDSYANTRLKNFKISAVELSVTSTFDDSEPQEGILAFPYTPVGAVSKTVHFILDGQELPTVTTSISGKQQTYIIPQQTHGAHILRVYFDAIVSGAEVRSNELYYEIIWLELFNDTPIIASSYAVRSVMQYTTVNIPYTVYNPLSQMCEVAISVSGEEVSRITVDRSQQVFSYRMDRPGEQTVTITAGKESKTITLNVAEADIDAVAETENLSLYLSAASRSNNETNPADWHFDDVAVAFSGFNWTSDGWQLDADGVSALRVAGDARLYIPFEIFARDFRQTGKTIEIEFATREVLNYDAVILSCMSGGRGISMTPQSCRLASEQSSISMQFKENEHVRVGFVVEKRSGYRRIYCYIDGLLSGVIRYPDGDDFSQVSPVGISIGSSECAIDLYCIRVYDNDLSSRQMLDNWIADTQDGAVMLARYSRNNVYDEYGNIVIGKLPGDLPYMVLDCAELPQYKGDKKTISGSYVDPINPQKSFTFTGCQADVQGTSSQYYERKNYKLKFKNGIVNNNGVTVSDYQMRDNAIPTSSFCMKADVASSEGANNVELAILYNDACVYKTPAQREDARIRQGIDGFPIVIFWHDTANDRTIFLGKYNFNNDKGTEEVFGFTEGDESWEVKNNTGDRVLWKNDDYSGSDWLNDFEARFPDTEPPYTDATQLAEFAAWIKSTDPEQATGNALPQPAVYDGTAYAEDTAEYRKAKFRAELSSYVELDSALFYYLFTELFLMVDSRAKNMFPSFIGSAIGGE